MQWSYFPIYLMDSMTTTPKKKSMSRVLGTVVVIGLLALVVVVDMKRRSAEAQLSALSMRLEQLTGGNTEKNKEEAKAIVAEARQLIDIPTNVDPTVATIVDVAALRKQNTFYNKAENGDVLIVTAERAILYRRSAHKIIDVVPVELKAPPANAAASSAPAAAPTPAPVQANQ